ncbi:MAG TPA: hypothetical protein VIH90_03350 [Candidatus Saccharimonadales bacterium]
MNNLVFDSRNDVNEDISDSDDLLHSKIYGQKQFRFLGHEASLVGAVLEETEDSFLVAMPVMIAGEYGSGQMDIIDTGGNPYIRLMKSTVGFVASPTQAQNDFYISHLLKNSPSEFPDLMEMLGLGDGDDQFNDEEIPSDGEDNFSPKIAQEHMRLCRIDNVDGDLVLTQMQFNSDIDKKVKKGSA